MTAPRASARSWPCRPCRPLPALLAEMGVPWGQPARIRRCRELHRTTGPFGHAARRAGRRPGSRPGHRCRLQADARIGRSLLETAAGAVRPPRAGGHGAVPRLFGAPAHFDSEISGMVFPATWPDRAIDGADAKAARLARLDLERALPAEPAPFSYPVQRVLHQMLVATSPSRDEMARLFAISPRALRLRLQAEATRFQQLLGWGALRWPGSRCSTPHGPGRGGGRAALCRSARVLPCVSTVVRPESPRDWRLALRQDREGPGYNRVPAEELRRPSRVRLPAARG
jgi:hypothetical protein